MKVGKYNIPDVRLYPHLYEATKRIYEEFRSEEAPNQLTVAQLLDHKSASGAFLMKIASLRAYGLVEKRGIKVTELGKKLTWGASEEEKNEALKQTILNIPLWKEFFSKWGTTLPPVISGYNYLQLLVLKPLMQKESKIKSEKLI